MILLTLPRRWACGLLVLCACHVEPSAPSPEEAEPGPQGAHATPTPGAASEGAPFSSEETRAAQACPPTELFAHALCLCEDLRDVGLLTVTAGSGGPGSVGVNGATDAVNVTRIAGALHAYQSFSAVADAEVGGELVTTGNATWVGRLEVGEDLSVGGDARGLGLLKLGGALRVAGRASLLGLAQGMARDAYEAPQAPPCGCDPSTFFDVAATVAAARDTNDNERIGLGEQLAQIGLRTLTLPEGSYYIADADTVGALSITVDGRVALHVEGHLDSVGLERIRLAPDAELDLYVSGGIRSVGFTGLGTPALEGRLRIYVGGEAPVLLSVGAQVFHGAIYAPEADVAYVGDTRIVGSLFARSLHGVGRLSIEHGRAAEPEPCDPSDPPDPVDPPAPPAEDGGAPDDAPDGGAPAGEPDAGAGDGDGEAPL